jgi:Holliday junction resolvase
MVNSRQKGMRAERDVADMLNRHSGLTFEQTPGSGNGKIKGDLYLRHHINKYLIEVKFYKEDPLSCKVFTAKSNALVQWWTKAEKQASEVGLEPLLFFRANFGKWFVGTQAQPSVPHIHLSFLNLYICMAEQWLETEKLEFSNGDRIYEPWKAAGDEESSDS